ncbi:MAG: hypothetical protein AAGB46_16715 [Verrucomicrobiota bacterium]
MKKSLRSKEGFTLLEITVAFFLLLTTSLGVLSGIVQSRRLTEGSIYHNTATTIAHGYLQQLMDMQYDKLSLNNIDTLTDVESSGLVAGSEDSLLVSPQVANPEVGDSNTDVVNQRQIDIHNTPDEVSDDLNLNLVLYANDISDPSNSVGSSRNVILRYSYTLPSRVGGRTASHTLFAIRSEVPNF